MNFTLKQLSSVHLNISYNVFTYFFKFLCFRLYHRLTNDMTDTKRNKNFLPNSTDLMKDLLKSLVINDTSSTYRDALLILDNVTSENVVSAFDIGLKTLITTQNKDCVKSEGNTCYVSVKTVYVTVIT